MKIRIIAALLATMTAVTACGAGPQASGTFQTHASYDRVFSAAIAAAPAVGYHVTGVNRADGVITAEQGVIMGHGSAGSLSVVVTREGNARTLRVSFIAPPGTMALGDFGQNVDQYVSAVRTGVPDLQASM